MVWMFLVQIRSVSDLPHPITCMTDCTLWISQPSAGGRVTGTPMLVRLTVHLDGQDGHSQNLSFHYHSVQNGAQKFANPLKNIAEIRIFSQTGFLE